MERYRGSGRLRRNSCRPPAPIRRRWPLLVACGLLAGQLGLTGCGAPPELHEPPLGVVASPTTPTTGPPTVAPTVAPAPTSEPPLVPPTPTGYPENTAVRCHDGPTRKQVVALARRAPGLLGLGTSVQVPTGPLCAGSWHYTVLQVPGHEPLQVVSEGRPGALRLVTAGTNVCTIDVRVGAPTGIRTLACDAA